MSRASKSKKVSIKDKIRKRAKEQQASRAMSNFVGDGLKFIKTEETMLFDIIPYEVTDAGHPENLEVGDLWFRRPYKVHTFTIDDKLKTYVCPKSIGAKCPICTYFAKMIKRGYSDKELKDFKAKDREVYNIIDLKNPKDGIKLFEVSPFLFGDLLNKDMADDPIVDEYGDFSDLQEGYSLRVRFDKTTAPGFNKPFLKASRIDYISRKKGYPANYYENAHSLDEILNVLSYEQLESILFNLDDEGIEDYKEEIGDIKENNDIDDSQWDKEEKKSSKKKKVKEPEPEVDPDDEVEPEEEKPARKKTTTKKKVKEPEPEDEPEEDPEEKKSPKKKPVSKKKVKEPEPEDEPEGDPDDTVEEGDCPSGYIFGEDCDQHDECEECPVWDSCSDLKEEIEKDLDKEKETTKKKKTTRTRR